MEEEQVKQPGVRRMSVLEKNKAAMKFVKMNEKPDNYILLNRHLDRAAVAKLGSS